ncbi:MAG TPA: protein kinase [Kofleriaceae bacterium]|nr:protein kinase [Kofleriaceae bacterium]
MSLVGRRLGDFELVAPIGGGSGGVVYRARQLTLAREAVVKLVERPPDGTAARFLREAQLASRLDHPFAAHVYAFGAERDLLWIAFERVDGTPLDQYLAARGPLPLARLLPFFDRLCQVVHTAHEQGIVHRDIKPANVIVVSRAGHLLPKLLDLGVARLLDRPEVASEDLERSEVLDAAQLALTRAGDQLGTPYYMAPEQWTAPGAVDARADVYGLGVLFYEVLTGRRPFDGDSLLAVARAHARRPLPPLPDGEPAALHQALSRAVAKRADDRFESPLALMAAIRAAAEVPDELGELPRLPADLLEWTRLDAPRPVADAVMALDGARTAEAAIAAACEVGGAVAHVLGVLALAAARAVGLGEEAAAIDLEGERVADATWWRLARAVTHPWAARPELFPLPALVDVFWQRDGAPADREAWRALEALGSGESLVQEATAAAAALMRAMSPIADLRLALGRGDEVEDWSGARGGLRAPLSARAAVPAGQVVLLDGDGAVALVLSPLAQASPPMPGAPDELFLVSGRGRSAVRLRARPIGYERSDPELGPLLTRELGLRGLSTEAEGEAGRSPYAGLAPFTAADADRFVGREAEAEAMANRLRVASFVAVVGASGAGKSSFVQAGVLPLLPADWRQVVIRPGIAPIANLTAALAIDPAAGDLGAAIRAAAGARPLVLVVDQFEEVLTLTHDRAESERYAAALVASASVEAPAVRVVLTLRDDFLMRAGSLPALRGRLSRELELLTTPAPDQLCRIVRDPAARAGYQLDDGLVEEMVGAVADQPGALALLSFTASRLWELRDRRTRRLTRTAYLALGAVAGALAQHAEATLGAIAPEDQPVVREAFRHLVTSEGTRAVLRRSELTELLPAASGERVIEHLIGARLLVGSEAMGGEQVEIIHEALLSSWPRLVGWRLDDAESLRLRDQLRSAARQWDQRGRQRGLLWRGDALVEFRAWRRRFAPALTSNEIAFAAAVFYWMNARAERSAAEVRRQIAATRLEQGRKEWQEGRPLQAIAYLAAGLEGDRPPPPWLPVLADFALEGIRAERLRLEHDARVGAVRRTADGRLIVSGDNGGTVRVWRRADGSLQASARAGGPVRDLALAAHSPAVLVRSEGGAAAPLVALDDGRVLAEAALATGEPVTAVAAGPAGFWLGGARGGIAQVDERGRRRWSITGLLADVALLVPDGERVIAVSAGDDAVVLSAGGEAGARLTGLGRCGRAALLPGDRLACGAADGGIRIHDLARGGAPLAVLRGHHDAVQAVEVSPDGAHLASAAYDGRLLVWRLADGVLLAAHAGHPGGIHTMRWRGDRLYSGGHDNAIKIWRPLVGLAARLDGHQGLVRQIDVSPDGAELVSASADRSVRVWQVPAGRARVVPVGAGARGVAFAGEHVVVAADDGIHRFDRAGRPLDFWPAPPLRALAVSGARIAAGGADGRIYWFDADGTPAAVAAHAGEVTRLEFTPDGRELASAGDDGTLHVWDAAARRRVRSERHAAGIWALAAGPGPVLWSGGDDRRLVRWERGRPGPAAATTLAESVNVIAPAPDGARVLVGLEDGSSWLYSSRLDRQLRAVGARGANVFDGEISPDGGLAAIAGYDAVLRLHELDEGRLIASLPLFASRAWALDYSPDGQVIAAVSLAGELALVALPRAPSLADLPCRTPFVVDRSSLRERPRPPPCPARQPP